MQHDKHAPSPGRRAGRLTRRALLGMAAVAALPLRTGQSAQVTGGDAAALVRQLYQLVDAFQYADAYALLGGEWRSRQSLDRFSRGYGDTAFVQCRTGSTVTVGATAMVPVELVAWHNGGGIVAYAGTYTIGAEQGRLAVLGADIRRSTVPPGTPALCRVGDLDLAFGTWQGAAGSREGSLRATNRGDAACALGGSPRIRVTDAAGNELVSTSEAGSPPEAIVVEPGQGAKAAIRFSNWCGATGGMPAVTAELPGSPATAPVSAVAEGIAYPPCNGPGQPASLGVQGWTR